MTSDRTLTRMDRAQIDLKALFVLTPYHKAAATQLQWAITRYMRLGHHTGIVLTGPSGSGKTTTILQLQTWANEIYPPSASGRSPILSVLTPAKADPASFTSAILAAGGDRFAWRDMKFSQREGRMHDMVQELKPLALVFEEFQHLFEGKTDREIRIATQVMKNMANALQIPTFLTGVESIMEFVLTSPELKQRFQRVVKLPKYLQRDAKILRSFRMLVREIANIVPFEAGVSATDDVTMLRFLLASNGVIRTLIDLCLDACANADALEDHFVGLPNLAEAYENILPDDGGMENPFLLEADRVRKLASRLLDP